MNVTIVKSDDWQGVYFDGILQTEGHSVRATEVLLCLVGKPEISSVDEIVASESWMEEVGCLPKYLREVVQ